ncbi:MAG: hypothetical protein IKU86_00950 [Thermoguttaceae bacterium]|nr:hypothetical protein [Thermoguttaceae bacterium]
MALKSELEENPFAPPIDDDFLKTALEYRDYFENDEEFREALAVWPRCPECGRRRVARCPICKTSGTLFPLGDNNFWDFRSDEEKERDAESFDEEENFGCSCGCGRRSATERRQNRAWAAVGRSKFDRETAKQNGTGGSRGVACACGNGGDSGDAKNKPSEPENLFEKGLVAVCRVCSEAFVPKFPKRCEWCDFEFPDGEEPTDDSKTPADVLAFLARKKAEEADDYFDQPATPRVFWTVAALALGVLAFCAYFAFLFR